VVVGFVLIIALALVTGSVLLIGYVAAAAALLIVVTLLVRKALRRESKVVIEAPVPRWVDAEEREAA
jgi:hypothetical protein